jgi:UDP-N-acetylglucosamine 1-carboxyvinyltransferase
MNQSDIPDALMREMRSSVVFLGAILARTGEAVLTYPGGCELGPRPIDLHLLALRVLGADIEEVGGKILCKVNKLQGGRIELQIASVGATENAMLMASRCEGKTIISNAAREPEIEDLQSYLQKLGVDIHGAGTAIITVEGKGGRKNVEHRIIPDRIVASTYALAVASAGGKAEITNVEPRHFATVLDVLKEAGCCIETGTDRIIVECNKQLKAVRPIMTCPYPGFPTDAQPPLMAASLKFEGTTVFVENIFENRYRHIGELLRMGADIRTEGRVAVICGKKTLHGASVEATDLRGGAALAVAALGAVGESRISGLKHIDRGYESLENAFSQLGAEIERI